MYVHMYVPTLVVLRIHVHTFIHACMHTCVCVRVRVHVHVCGCLVCFVCMRACVYVGVEAGGGGDCAVRVRDCVCMCMCVCVCVCVCVCLHLWCVSVYVCVCVCVCMHSCVCVLACGCIYVQACIPYITHVLTHPYTHNTHTRLHTHTYTAKALDRNSLSLPLAFSSLPPFPTSPSHSPSFLRSQIDENDPRLAKFPPEQRLQLVEQLKAVYCYASPPPLRALHFPLPFFASSTAYTWCASLCCVGRWVVFARWGDGICVCVYECVCVFV